MPPKGKAMITTWSEWKRYPRAGRGENIEAPISPGLYEVRFAGTGALHSFGAVDNVAQALSLLTVGSEIVVQPSRCRGLARSRIPDLRHLVEVRRAQRGGTHDRPARSLYERRGLTGRIAALKMA